MREHEVAHREGAFDFGCRREQDVLEQLHVAVVADGKVRREQGDLVRYGLQAVTASAHDLEDVGVLLVGHDARPRGEVVGQRYEAEVLAHEQADVHRQAADGRSDGRDGVGGGAFAFAAAHLCRHDVVV